MVGITDRICVTDASERLSAFGALRDGRGGRREFKGIGQLSAADLDLVTRIETFLFVRCAMRIGGFQQRHGW